MSDVFNYDTAIIGAVLNRFIIDPEAHATARNQTTRVYSIDEMLRINK